MLQPLLRADSPPFGACCVAAQALANAGRYEQAVEKCQQATRAEPFSPLPWHILARIAEEQGRDEEAKALLKKVVYLAPSLAMPYLDLASLYAREGDVARAAKARANALQILEAAGQSEFVQTHPLSTDAPVRADEMKQHLRHLQQQPRV